MQYSTRCLAQVRLILGEPGWDGSITFMFRQSLRLLREFCPGAVELEADFVSRFLELDANGYGDKSELFVTLRREFDLVGAPGQLLEEFRAGCWQEARLFAGGEKALVRLRSAGLRLGVVTNGSSTSQRAKIGTTGLEGWLDAVLISGEVGLSKPDRKLFELGARELGASASDCLCVGDHPETVVGAARAWMTTGWVSHGEAWPSGPEVGPPSSLPAFKRWFH